MSFSKKNHSKVLFQEIERQEKAVVRVAAAKVADRFVSAEKRLADALQEAKRAKKLVKKMEKAIAKYKKSGDIDDLKIFGA